LAGAAASEKRQRSKGLAICLSGGGYRAALFHLGTLRAMHEARMLERVETVSSVSGGSILAAFLANRVNALKPTGLQFADWENDIAAPFRQLMKTDIRTAPILCHVLWNWLLPNFRARHIQSKFRKLIGIDNSGKAVTLGELPESPEFIVCASDLPHGVSWEFRRDRVGSYQSGKAAIPQMELSFAVGASACFPPVFGPITFDFTNFHAAGKDQDPAMLKRMMLSDGGVYDNLGFEPVLKNHLEIFLSDGGSPFGFSSSILPWNRFSRFFFVMMNQVAALRKRQFFRDQTAGLFVGSYFGIGYGKADGGYPQDLVDSHIASIRTDLDRFSEAESRILDNHGYTIAAQTLLTKQPELVPAGVTLNNIPHPELMDEASVRAALKSSASRFSIKRLLRLT
jgi:NTE family protein